MSTTLDLALLVRYAETTGIPVAFIFGVDAWCRCVLRSQRQRHPPTQYWLLPKHMLSNKTVTPSLPFWLAGGDTCRHDDFSESEVVSNCHYWLPPCSNHASVDRRLPQCAQTLPKTWRIRMVNFQVTISSCSRSCRIQYKVDIIFLCSFRTLAAVRKAYKNKQLSIQRCGNCMDACTKHTGSFAAKKPEE